MNFGDSRLRNSAVDDRLSSRQVGLYLRRTWPSSHELLSAASTRSWLAIEHSSHEFSDLLRQLWRHSIPDLSVLGGPTPEEHIRVRKRL